VELPLDITIIVPNYNTKALLRECLASIYTHTAGISFEVICVDDNSSDGSADMVASEFPQAILVRNKVGLLYAKNNNLGMKMSRARYACLLNSDTNISANAFGALVEFMDTHPAAAACSPTLLNPDGSVQLSVRRYPGLMVLLLQSLNWHKLFPDGKVGREYYASNLDHSREQVVDAVGSTALVLRRSTWENAGMLDERFPLYSVDLAYCYMLKQKELKLYYTPVAQIVHHGSQSLDQMPKKSLRAAHDGFQSMNRHYDYFGKSIVTKTLISWAIELRYRIKLLEWRLSKDKRANSGPGRPKLDTPSPSSK